MNSLSAGQAANFETNSPVVILNSAIWWLKRPKPCSTPSMSRATFSVSVRIAAMVELIESAASAVSSTAAVIIVTVWACNSIAERMRSAECWTSTTVDWIDPLASTVWRVAAHGFAWMRDLRALGTDPARMRARDLAEDWLTRGANEDLAQAPEVAAARVSAWLGHWDFFAATAEDGFRRRLLIRLAQDARGVVSGLPAEAMHRGALVTLKGAIAAAVGAARGDVAVTIAGLRARGHVTEIGPVATITDAGRTMVATDLAAVVAQHRSAFVEVLDRFLGPDRALKALVTEWQLRRRPASGEHDGDIDLLLTDIVMPWTGGVELAGRFAALHPRARVLFVSGFPERAADLILGRSVDPSLAAAG